MLHRLALVFSMVFLLLFSQQGALLHEFSHYQEEQSQSSSEKSSHGTLFCDQCLAHASANGAPAPDGWQPPRLRSTEVKHAAQATASVTTLNLTPAARDPPQPA